ncbi:MgtC/SapB family protein [Rubrivivax benzoatilyticus]|uniref:DUF4010 domain-containing protein n=1 Tax=Rubrivivax benzoatilyticus TaxID=316997 RepID=A0ABX0HQQ2_9BURK|nr:DUF4010 domain-containing protein [Rubrivivax benzoatilyticus]EGJ10817.1 putative transmembrane protein [Rubrivivax benzoatilyticus JA2 = ATCC BAA-35]NHK97397.1 DUF4010 domain-containing protein [Rubrivivax benzoatilyticus]NHL22908.1 DUF4010 domain-containing protein [Rubrivivax benzoatilyticus]
MGLDTASAPLALGLLSALGGGLLIGLERERRKGSGPDREPAGIRSFTLAALAGAIAQALDEPLLVACGGLAVLALAAVAYWRSQIVQRSPDPGMTTELALFVTYLVGVLSMQQPPVGGGAAVVIAVLLAAQARLHRFATRALSEAELHDALLLAALVLVVLPLLPATPVAWLGGLQPRTLGLLATLILVLQAGGHVALRLFGATAGMALSGLLSGFVSSTATIASMGTRVRAEPALARACEAGAVLSTAATWVLGLVILTATSPPLAAMLVVPAVVGIAVAGAGGLWRARGARGTAPESSKAGPLRPREALLVAVLLAGASLGVGWAQRHFGDAGVLAGAALTAVADAHAACAALGALAGEGRLELQAAAYGVLVAITTNSVTRSITAFVAGGPKFGVTIAGSLAASTGAAWAAWWGVSRLAGA